MCNLTQSYVAILTLSKLLAAGHIHQVPETSLLKHDLCKYLFLLLFRHSVVSDSLWPHGLQHARLPCPSLSSGVCSNSCPLSQWSNHLIFCHPLLLLPSVFPSISVFSNESALRIRWPKYWSFSISPSNEYSGLISFRIDWFGLLKIQGIFKSSLALQFESILFCTY